MGMTKIVDDLENAAQPVTNSSKPREQVELEERVRKLETALAERSTPAIIEETVAERVLAKLSATVGSPQASVGQDRVLVLASRHDDLPPPPKGTVLQPPDSFDDPLRRTWFFAQLGAEIRVLAHMYFDTRYRISRTTQFALPGIALLLVFNYFFFALWLGIPFVSPIAERLIDLVLCVIGYKLLTRELGRYREVLAYLARYGSR
jgi:hypothetical protein